MGGGLHSTPIAFSPALSHRSSPLPQPIHPNPPPRLTLPSSFNTPNGGDVKKLKTPGQKVSAKLQEDLRTGGLRVKVVDNLDRIRCRAHMIEILQSMLQAETKEGLQKAINEFDEAKLAIKQLYESVKKATANVKSKNDDATQASAKAESQRLTATQAKAVEDSKKIAKDLGNKIKEDAEKIAVVFTISDTDLLAVGVKAMAKIDANALPDHHSMRFPFLIMADFPALYLWNASPKTQMLLAAYGGNYKRTGAGFKTTKRTQEQILKQSGAAETKIFCDKLIGLNFPETLVDKEHLNEGCKTVTDAMWLYGLSDSLASVALPPYGLPMYKTLMSGEMKWILFEIKSLKESIKKTYLRDGDVHTYKMEDLIDEIIPNLTA